MVRKKKKVETEVEEDLDWPFEISIKIDRSKPRIAFLSGCERSYYPEDPGHSRFALKYCLPDPDDTARCNFVPSTNLLDKPVSTLGYGMGGLLAPRFAPNLSTDNPAPNAYQGSLVPKRVKAKEQAKKTKWKDFVAMYESIVEQQFAKYEEMEKNMSKALDRAKPSMKDRSNTSATTYIKTPHVQAKSEINILCRHKTSAFGMSLSRPRFAKDERKLVAPGPGTHNWHQPFGKKMLAMINSEGKLVPRVRTVCLPGSCDTCMSCGMDLIESDYYQTRTKFKMVNKHETDTWAKQKMRYLSLCRDCYCQALVHGQEPWCKEKIPKLFMKARHCISVHDHKEGHQEFLARSTCKQMTKLARNELLYSRYFKDTPCRDKISFGSEL